MSRRCRFAARRPRALRAHGTGDLLARRSAHPVLRRQRALQDGERGESWTTISPDLTRAAYDVPASLGAFTSLDPEEGKHRGVIYTIAPSFRRLNLLWIGTDDGLIWVTHTGGRTWRNVTPPALTPWSKVSIMEASHFDTLSAYAAVNRFRVDDVAPHIYRTKDGGKTWKETVEGIPSSENVNVVRRTGTAWPALRRDERSVYVSFDDGDHWQSLRQNLPPSSMRDLQVKDNDLIVGTHGRSIWILDDLTPLRQLAAASRATSAYLFQPAPAYRVRWNLTPIRRFPPTNRRVKTHPMAPSSTITSQARQRAPSPSRCATRAVGWCDASRAPIRSQSIQAEHPRLLDPAAPGPDYGGGDASLRVDLHYPPPPARCRTTTRSPRSMRTRGASARPRRLAGAYEVRLSAGGRALTQPLTIRMDPRVRVTPAALAQQFAAASRLAAAMGRSYDALQAMRALHLGSVTDSLERAARGLNGQLAGLLDLIDGVDAARRHRRHRPSQRSRQRSPRCLPAGMPSAGATCRVDHRVSVRSRRHVDGQRLSTRVGVARGARAGRTRTVGVAHPSPHRHERWVVLDALLRETGRRFGPTKPPR